jgi:hypothetical protein
MESINKHNLNVLFDERLIWAALIVLVSLFSCDSNSTSDSYAGITGTIEQIPILPDSYEYAMWLNENENTRLMTSFVPGDDLIFRLASAPQSDFIADTDEIYVTIEEKNSSYVDPSIYEIIGARFTSNDEASVKTYPITSDFSSVAGSVSITIDDTSIISFLDDANQSLLNLPTLNDGWKYTVWFEINAMDIPLFSFKSTDEITQDLTSDVSIIGGVIKIGVEPELFSLDEASLGMYLLQYNVEGNSGVFDMNTTLENLPTGVINKEK